jgi:hypothetical protein
MMEPHLLLLLLEDWMPAAADAGCRSLHLPTVALLLLLGHRMP